MEFTVSKGSCGREILYEFETLSKAYQVLTGTEYVPKKGGPDYFQGGSSVGSKSTKSKSSTKSEKKIATSRSTARSTGRDSQPLPPIAGSAAEENPEEEDEEEIIRGGGIA